MPTKKASKRIIGTMPKTVKGLVTATDPNPDEELTFTLFLNPVKRKIPSLRKLTNIAKRSNLITSRAKFRGMHNTTKEDIGKLKEYFDGFGLTIKTIKLTERWIAVKGKIADIERALKIDILRYDFDNLVYFFHNGVMQIPHKIAHLVEAITGINKAPIKEKKVFPRQIDVKNAILEGRAVSAKDFERLYNFPKGLDGSGECLGIISLGGGYDKEVLKKYFKKQGIAMPDISWVPVGDGKNDPGKNLEYDYEVYMDVEIAACLAPGAKIVVYFAKNHKSNILKAFKQAIHDDKNKPSVISLSWGSLEDTFSMRDAHTLNNALKEAANLNITLVCSSGDLGSSGMPNQQGENMQLPASSPYVLAVGGTQTHIEDNKILHEDVWKQDQEMEGQLMHGSSGGGFSKRFPMPKYQSEVLPLEFTRKNKRGLPDVSANASTFPGILLSVGQTEQISMGTSASTPLWAALLIRVNQKMTQLGLPHIGFIHPFIYKDEFRPLFNQVVSGSNGKYEATAGWDPCTGLGTPNGEVFLQQMIKMQTAIHGSKMKE